MCSTGHETMPLAIPATTPAVKSCPEPNAVPSGPPTPRARFCAWKMRFVYSRAPNWIETQTPMPSKGDKVPYARSEHVQKRTRRNTHLVERQRPLVLQDTPCTMHHARVRPRRRRLHSLRVQTIGQPAPHPPTRIPLTTLTISNGWPTRTWSERASVLYSRCARHCAHLEDAADGAGRQVFCGARHGDGGAEKEGRGARERRKSLTAEPSARGTVASMSSGA